MHRAVTPWTVRRDSALFFVTISFHFYVFMHCHRYFWLFMYQEQLAVREEYSYKLCGILCLLQAGGTADTLTLETRSRARSRDCGPRGHWELGAAVSHLSETCVCSTFPSVGMLASIRLPLSAQRGTGRTAEEPEPFAKAGDSKLGDLKFCLSKRQGHIISKPIGYLQEYKVTGF